MSLSALLEFESAFIKGAQTQNNSVNSAVAASLRAIVEQIFFNLAPSFLIIISCRRQSPENFFMEIMQRLYNIVDDMIIELVHLNHTKAYTLEHTAYVNLVLVDSLEAFLDLNLHEHASGYDSNEYYYIFLQQRDRFIPAEMLEIFKYCWQHQFINCNVQIQNAKAEVYMYTYFPFVPGKCEHIESVLIDKFIGPRWQYEIFFPDKLRNFYKCTLLAVVRHIPPFLMVDRDKHGEIIIDGLEGQLINQLSAHYNFTLEVVVAPVDERTGNFCCGALAMLGNRSAHMGIGFYRMWVYFANNITTTFPHHQNRLIGAIYLKGYNLTTYQIWGFPFRTNAWLVIFIAFGGVLSVVYFIRMYQPPSIMESRIPTALYVTAAALGVTIHRQPRTTTHRYLFIFTIMSTFLLRAMYSALLFHVFRSHIHQPLPTTIEEVFHRGFMPVMNLFAYNDFATIPYMENLIKTNRVLLNSTNDASAFPYLEQHYEQNLVAFTSRDVLLHYVVEEHKPGMYYILPDELTKQQLLIWLQKHSYLVDLFTQSMLQLHAVGLMAHWATNLVDLKYFKSSHLLADKLLGQQELYGIYIIVGYLYAISLLVFALEVLSKKYKPFEKLLKFYYY